MDPTGLLGLLCPHRARDDDKLCQPWHFLKLTVKVNIFNLLYSYKQQKLPKENGRWYRSIYVCILKDLVTENNVDRKIPSTLKWSFHLQKHGLQDSPVLMACHCPPRCQQLLLSHPSLQTTPSCKNYLKQRRAFSNQTFFVLFCFCDCAPTELGP